MADVDATVSNLFADLKRLENNGDYEKALKTASKVLDLSPNNQKAVHCKVVCLIQLNKFDEALEYLNNLSNDLKSTLNFEKAYCEYRLNQVNQALESLKLSDPSDLAVSELRIQALYRIEEYEKCYSDYVDLIKNSGDDYEDERYVNLTAVSAGISLENGGNPKSKDLDLNENTYEIIYNKACILIGNGAYEAAVKKLNEAEAFCRKFLEEDGASEEEIDTELAIIKAQIAFCQQKLGKDDISLKLYNQILRQKLADQALVSVSSNNIVVIHKDQNVFDSKKKIKNAMNENAELKLSTSQKRNIFYNYCLFLINTNQFDVCRKELEVFKNKFSNTSDAIIIESYLYLKEKNVPQAIKVLSNYCSSKKSLDKSDLELVLLLVQLHIKAQNFKDATQTMEKLGSLVYLPALFSALYVLYEKQNNLKAIEDLFLKGIKWHESQKSASSILSNLYREAAKFYLNQNKPQIAVKYLEKIIATKGKNAKITSMLINAYSQFDTVKAQSLQNELPSIEEILSSVDIEHLENKNWSLGVKYVKKTKDTPKAPEKKKKKNRKKILPKNYNPNEQPDPERWLPKYERSNYRKKKDKKGVGKGTQGAIGEAPEIKPSPKQLIPSPQGPRQQRPTAAQKKKKKGGRK